MHINTECITLRMFSGMHLGAEISLCEGSYIIGRDNSCDIILQDQSIESRHVQLTISCIQRSSSNAQNEEQTNSYRVEVHVKNLDGNISHKDEVLSDDASISMQQPYMLGQVCFAWFKYGESENIANIQDELQTNIFNSQNPKPNDVASNQVNDLSSDNIVGVNDNEDGINLQNLSTPMQTASVPRWRRYMLLGIIFILLLGITITIRDNLQTEYNSAILLEKKLVAEKFPSLSVGEYEDMISIHGLLANNQEFSRLTTLVQNMHFPVYLDVDIERDLIDAMIKKLNQQGLYPIIDVNSESKELNMRMYLKDELIFNGLKIQLQELFSAIQSYKVIYDIHYANKVRSLIIDKLDEKLKKKLNFEFLPGIIKIIGNLSDDEFAKVKNVISEVSKALRIVLVYDFIKKNVVANAQNSLVTQSQALPLNVSPRLNDMPVQNGHMTPSNNEVIILQAPNEANKAKVSSSTTYDFKVTSVNLSPISYIILSTEQRVFRGGILPGGYTLTDIELDELTLEKNNIITKYYLNNDNN